MKATLAQLQAEISGVLVDAVEPMFISGVKLTLVARFPGQPTKTVIVSSDDIDSVVTDAVIKETALAGVTA